MSEGELYRKIREISKDRFQFPLPLNELKIKVQDMVNMNRERDVVAALAVSDKAKQEFPNVELNMLSPQLDYDECKELIDKIVIWRIKWFGEVKLQQPVPQSSTDTSG